MVIKLKIVIYEETGNSFKVFVTFIAKVTGCAPVEGVSQQQTSTERLVIGSSHKS